MAEGLSPAEVGKEIGVHKKHGTAGHGSSDARDRVLSIIEAVLLSLVAVLAAWSGYAAAKWTTESSVSLAKAAAARTKSSRDELEATQIRTLDSVSFQRVVHRVRGAKPHRRTARRESLPPGLQARILRVDRD